MPGAVSRHSRPATRSLGHMNGAIGITAAEIYVSITGKPSPSIDNAFTLIVAIYFVRMNHTKVGGVGGTADSR